jgi:hypothetical protein
MTALPVHPIAKLVPNMSTEQFSELRGDIREHGLRVPIVLYDGKILDGRNRAEAWFDIKGNWDVPSTVFEGSEREAVDFVRSHNITRRHLKSSQRAYFESQAAEFGKARPGQPKKNSGNFPNKPTQTTIAKSVGIDVKTIAKAAKAVKLGGAPVAAALRNGSVSVDRALAVAKMPEPKRKLALEDRSVPVPRATKRPRSEFAEYNRGVEAAARLVARRGRKELADEVRDLKR